MGMQQQDRVESQVAAGGQLLERVPDEPFYRRGEQARRWGALLILVGVVWLVFSFTARGPFGGLGFGFVEHGEPIAAQAFAVERVVVRGLSDNLELLPASGDEVRLEGTRFGFGWNRDAAEDALERLEVVTTASGDTLTVEVRRPGLPSPVNLGNTPYAELQLFLPPGVQVETDLVSGEQRVGEVRADLDLSTVSGGIQTEATVGALRVRSTSGDLQLREHNGTLDVETVSGDVEADGALSSPRVETVSGDVSLEGVEGEAEVYTISGDLALFDARAASLRVESTSGDVQFVGSLADTSSSRISSISGDVFVELADAPNLRLELSTTSGDLDSDLDLRDALRERRQLSGTLGDGDGLLAITTTSGDVRVDGE